MILDLTSRAGIPAYTELLSLNLAETTLELPIILPSGIIAPFNTLTCAVIHT